jgi:hypothetical protein
MNTRIFLFGVFAALIVGCVTGCGHNALVFSKGKYLNIGVDPSTQKAGVQYVNGEQLTAVERDNIKLTVEMKDTLDANGKTTSTISKIIYEIGNQTTGYDVELIEAEKK